MSSNIRKFRKRNSINLGVVFFLIIFIYMIICVVMFFTSKHITGYEVKTGSLSVSNIYEGIAIRDEVIVTSGGSGYVNYYAREGEKVGSGNVVCSIDETGQLVDLMNKEEYDGKSILTDHDYSEIKSEIIDFSSNFKKSNFLPVYDFKYSIAGSVLKFSNRNLLENLSYLNEQNNVGLISLCKAPASGVVIYTTDGFENRNLNDIEETWFDKSVYEKEQLINNAIVAPGDTLYKLTNNENWIIIFPCETKRAEELLAEEYVKVKFLKNQYESWGRVELVTGADERTYVALHFNNSMITFVTDRFINIELITDLETGLKVPNSSIINKEFFLIPKNYLTSSGLNNSDSVLRQVYAEDGSTSTEYVNVTLYSETEGEYYVDNDSLRPGDRIIAPDSQEEFTVSKTGTLVGVYNINKGYADFKEIDILNQNDEYAIVKSNTTYGLVAFDHIVLDAESVEKDEFIYD